MRYLKLYELKVQKSFSDWLKDPKKPTETEFKLTFPVRKHYEFASKEFSLEEIDNFCKKESGMSVIEVILIDMDLDRDSVLANEKEIFEAWIDQEYENQIEKFYDTFGLNYSELVISDGDFENIKNSFNDQHLEKYFDSRSFNVDFNILSMNITEPNEFKSEISVLVKLSKEISEDQKEIIKDFLAGQLADGWGEGFSQKSKREKNGKLVFKTWIEFYWGSGYPQWEITLE